jgi:glycosyltransferase involved in cell wall biosynthesis
MPGIGLDTDVYSPQSVTPDAVRRVRKELWLGHEDRLFLMIAEFHPNKRHDDALHALALTRNERIHMAFAGNGGTETQIAELAASLGLTSQVHFLGFREDISALIRASTATFLVSDREGLPRSILESLSLGVPVVGSDIRGIRELLEPGSGILVPPGGRQQLAKAMEQLTEEPELVSVMAQNARRQAMAYDIRELLKLHEKLYLEALQSPALDETSVPDRQRV